MRWWYNIRVNIFSFVNTCPKNQLNGKLKFGALRIQKRGTCERLRFFVEPAMGSPILKGLKIIRLYKVKMCFMNYCVN